MSADPQNILVVHLAGLGQTVLALPALRSLRQHLPHAHITVVSSTAAADLLRIAKCADEVLAVGRLRRIEALAPRVFYRSVKTASELRRHHYDLAIELRAGAESGFLLQLAQPRQRLGAQSNSWSKGLRSAIEWVTEALAKRPQSFKHAAHTYLDLLAPLGVRPMEAEPRLTTDREADERIEKLLSKHGLRDGELLAGLHPGAGPGQQRWPVERFASIGARLIHNFNARVLVFAGPHERGLARRVVGLLPAKRALAIESPKMPDFVSALARLSVLIANHAGPAHVAAAVGTPVVVASTFAGPSAQDLLSKHHVHIRRERAEMIPEEEVYDAACGLLQMSRAEILRAL
jgi:ADP-heptose:LPS heptosyltransferase